MTKPVYRLWMARRTEAWYQLSDEERNEIMARLGESFERVGGKMTIICDSAWSTEQYTTFGVEEFPSSEAAQEHTDDLLALDWFRYVESTSILGTKQDVT